MKHFIGNVWIDRNGVAWHSKNVVGGVKWKPDKIVEKGGRSYTIREAYEELYFNVEPVATVRFLDNRNNDEEVVNPLVAQAIKLKRAKTEMVAKVDCIESVEVIDNTLPDDCFKVKPIKSLNGKKRGRVVGFKMSAESRKLLSESKRSVRYSVGGVIYDTIEAAAIATGLNRSTVYGRCRSGFRGFSIVR